MNASRPSILNPVYDDLITRLQCRTAVSLQVLSLVDTSDMNTLLMGKHTRRGHKLERRKRKIARDRRKRFVLKRMYFSVIKKVKLSQE